MILLVAGLLPVVSLMSEVSWSELEGIASSRHVGLLARSMGIAGAVTALALLVGVPLGVIFARVELPLRRVLFAVHLSRCFLPPFLLALGW